MKKFTKQERHEIYKSALEEHLKIQPSRARNLCYLIHCSIMDKHRVYLQLQVITTRFFPELNLFKPYSATSEKPFWFSKSNYYDSEYVTKEVKDHQQIVLMFCIEMTR